LVKLKSWRRCLVTFALVAIASVGLYANYSHVFYIGGSNNPSSPYMGLFAHGWVHSDPEWYGYPSGPTYIQVRLDGYAGYCTAGFPDGGWCADNAHQTGFGAWHSEASMRANIVPYGCYTGTVRVFIMDQIREQYPNGSCFDNPPPPEEPCDPALDGSYEEGACISPVVIATNGQRYKFTRKSAGVYFDLNADGVAELTAWSEPDAGVEFLAYDRNGNGTIDSGLELFGDRTEPGLYNGFAALRKLSGNPTSGALTAADPAFSALVLWNDRNHDGVSQAEELRPASDAVEAIGLSRAKSKSTTCSSERSRTSAEV
jgi:hypothetical protein